MMKRGRGRMLRLLGSAARQVGRKLENIYFLVSAGPLGPSTHIYFLTVSPEILERETLKLQFQRRILTTLGRWAWIFHFSTPFSHLFFSVKTSFLNWERRRFLRLVLEWIKKNLKTLYLSATTVDTISLFEHFFVVFFTLTWTLTKSLPALN